MSENKIKFGKIFWPSLVAALIVSIIGTLIFILIVSGLISGFSNLETKQLNIDNKTVLHLTLDGQIGENGSTKFDKESFSIESKIGLSAILNAFKEAEKDQNIKGIFIEITDLKCGFSTAKEIREAINEFERSGKFAIAYNSGEVITQKEYYISSAANTNYAFPTSTLEFMGLGSELMFFKNTLDKLEVEIQVVRGKNNDFKSAVEPFFRENMSDSSRLQIQRYLTSIWADIRLDISKDRKVSVEKLNEIAENALIRRAKDAVKYKLIDATKYRDEVLDLISKKIQLEKDKEINFLSFEKYAKKKFYQEQILVKSEDPNIAVILAEGDVSTSGDGLTSENICELFREVRKMKSIKTVVFRINSPGGSALASDEIWREVKLTNKVKKVIVSMGDVAASGGYYIAAPATTIFAEPTSITGSIGVFGMIPYTGKMLENKLGLTFDRASTNSHAILSLNRKLTPEEFAIIQNEVDDIYFDFLNRVAEGRGMTTQQVNKIARGRVWTGRDAQKIGLVDQLGGIEDAIKFAAKKAGIKDSKILYFPNVKEDKLADLLEMIEDSENKASIKTSTKIPEEFLEYYQKIKSLEKYTGIQMRIPYEISLN